MRPLGEIAIVLHAHLPFVRDPDVEDLLEERWLYEAITECYLPLLEMLYRLEEDGVSYGLTISLSPTLLAMWDDPLLRERYERYLDRSFALLERVRALYPDEAALGLYERRLAAAKERFSSLKGDLAGAFGAISREGSLELITCALSHPILPLLDARSAAVQIKTAQRLFAERFGFSAPGFWLPESAYAPGLEELLGEARYVFLDTHGLTRAAPRALYGPFAPAASPSGLAFFARDPESSKQIWSREEGYPGDPEYRDFYRDVGFDLPLEVVGPFLPPSQEGPIRTHTGLKLHRITQRNSEEKAPYDPARAMLKAESHAAHFAQSRFRTAADLAGRLSRPPLFVAPFDAELFGHWWFEGPVFLERLLRLLAEEGKVRATTPSSVLERTESLQVLRPPASSWGEGGGFAVWTEPESAEVLTACQKLSQRLSRLKPSPSATQAARELALAEASDWPFLIRTRTNAQYARARQKEHLEAAQRFLAMAEGRAPLDPAFLTQRMRRTPPWRFSWST